MKPIETIKNLVKRALSVGTPPAKKVLYKEIVKREQATLSKVDRLEVKKETIEEVPKVSIETKIPKAKTAEKKQEIKKPIVKKEKTKTVKAKTPTKKVVTPEKTAPKKATIKKATTKKTAIKKTTPKEEKVATVKAKAPAKKKVSTAKKVVTPKETIKKETIKKETIKKQPIKKEIEKPVSVKKAPTKQSKATPKMTKKEEKIALYTKDIQKHYHEVDEAFLAIIVKNLGPSIYRKNAELVSCSDPKELDTVRRNFLIKKLGMTQEKDILDGFIQDVCQELKGVSHKYRATFYYRLAKNLKKESALS